MECISEKDIKQKVNAAEKLVMLECFSKHSGSTEIMRPILNKIERTFSLNLSVYRLDTLTCPDFAREFQIYHHPSYLFFFQGRLIDKLDEMLPLSEFASIIESHLEHLNISGK
jgi:thioredoxin-like negative regulator of GroEL